MDLKNPVPYGTPTSKSNASCGWSTKISAKVSLKMWIVEQYLVCGFRLVLLTCEDSSWPCGCCCLH